MTSSTAQNAHSAEPGSRPVNSSVALSLIICTRNRADALQRCLNDLSVSELDDVQGELILVDNGSSDDTPDVMQRFAAQATCPVTIVEEPTAGLSRARNAGLTHADGDIIAFTDDDCYLGDDYFRIARHVFTNGSYSYCGGRILLYDTSDAAYGLREQETFELVPAHSFIPTGYFQGANLVVHRRVFDAVGQFDTRLGAGTPFRCEDVEFIARASQAGFAGAHVPELVVYHHHGRKPGADIEHLAAANDYARGAYYAKLIQQGHLSYLRGWLQNSLLHRKNLSATLPPFLREVRGAVNYIRST
jgi:hypothetical protein